jgi:hypothetical protein
VGQRGRRDDARSIARMDAGRPKGYSEPDRRDGRVFKLTHLPMRDCPSYATIQAFVLKHDGFVAQTCWIADVKKALGYPVRTASNRQGADSRHVSCNGTVT